MRLFTSGKLDISRWESCRELKKEVVNWNKTLRRKGAAKRTKKRKKEIW